MALRREVRLRKDFLYKKAQGALLDSRNDKKRAIKRAIDGDKSVPTELRHEARRLHHESQMDVTAVDKGGEKIDDEYAQAGIREPKVCVTTSRDPSSRLKQFAKEVKIMFPNSVSINRGNTRVDELIGSCRKADFTDLVVLVETRGNPDGMTVCHLPYGPTAYFTLSNTVLRHDIPDCQPASQAHPHLILDGLDSKIGQRVGRILQALYPVPRPESRRIITFANRDDHISFRHHMYDKSNKGKVVIKEAGPRFEMDLYEIRLGTMDQETAEKEYVLRPYQNTARKKTRL
jgi:U3 small nucleolar ribonucleoprotein protein IMP4